LIFQDWKPNKGTLRVQLMLVLFRLAQLARLKVGRLAFPISAIYRTYSNLFTHVELPVQTSVGKRLVILHGIGLVVNGRSVIGDDVVLRHNVTIGERTEHGPCPVIGNKVKVGVGAIILGEISIGEGAIIAAGALVLKSVESGQVARGPYATNS